MESNQRPNQWEANIFILARKNGILKRFYRRNYSPKKTTLEIYAEMKSNWDHLFDFPDPIYIHFVNIRNKDLHYFADEKTFLPPNAIYCILLSILYLYICKAL